jgi:lipopolysaccharide biosynthesis glycosyltransferase
MNPSQREIITLISTANSKFYPGLIVALYTALENSSGKYDYDVIVLDGGLTSAEIEKTDRLLSTLAREKNIAINVTNRVLTPEELQILPVRRGSPLTNARLLVPKLFPDMKKAVYLDSDVVCARGIEDFFEKIDDSFAISACLDPHRILKSDRTVRDRIKPSEYEWPYFNAGVIGINVARWREKFDEIIALLSAENEWKHADQSLLNYLFRGQWNRVEPLANVCLTLRNCAEGSFIKVKANIHFIGPVKPWMSNESNFYRRCADQFFDQAWLRINPGSQLPKRTVSSKSLSAAKRKIFWYQLFQPTRARLYRSALRLCQEAELGES